MMMVYTEDDDVWISIKVWRFHKQKNKLCEKNKLTKNGICFKTSDDS